jgi:inner membrane protein
METIQSKNILDRINESISQSITFKLISIGILILLLLIPKSMINSLIVERERRMEETIHEVTDKWSRKQTVTGPILTIPYKKYIESEEGNNVKTLIKNATFLPEVLNIESEVVPEERYRGIFKVIVYKAQLTLKGRFPKFDFSEWDIDANDVLWNKASLNVGISDLRGIEKQVVLKLKDLEIPFQPGVSETSQFRSGIHIPLQASIQQLANQDFSIDISLKGSEELFFVPVGKNTDVKMTSSWKDPSFTGSFLPEREINPNGFKASWKILHFNRNYPQSWANANYDIAESKFGVNLLIAADHYQKSLRSSKYSILIITLSFLMFFLIEVTQKLRIHAFQYILIGLALMIFYTLLLSISEHLGFNLAYWISCLSVIGLISFYSSAVLANKQLSYLLAGSLTMIYGFIFIIIQIETYALLVGSIGLFTILAITMFYTRKISWYRARTT